MPVTSIQAVVFDLVGTLLSPVVTDSPPRVRLLAKTQATLDHLLSIDVPVAIIDSSEDRCASNAALKHGLDSWRPLLLAPPARVERPLPCPDMPVNAALRIGATQFRRCLFVTASLDGVAAGLNAGFWTVGIALGGLLPGIDLTGWEKRSSAEQDRLRMDATVRLMNAGAHYVIDGISELAGCLDDIEGRHGRRDTPQPLLREDARQLERL
ncbi:hypothetical protein SAMN05216421_1571 [Halopseudomonas xinjiangensis]|uniref:Beta-phosphoglucomutase, HAD superfamily n=1 Tax=Halopseudomonas xinjiangensis TaxID=487184 RepID=A0A1H1SE08_9GAMM|nr:hypothetical protein [Halopseudomonas xinjiangensis]SDS46217.1 hypothetical protein SAMN05216421_1571 [Halopseudomonas xinjiangensis]